MFSFIKFFQSLMNKMKRNKGLWFTLLSVISVLGVIVSMSFIKIMTKDVKHKTYMHVYKQDIQELENVLNTQYDYLLSVGGVVAIHPDIISNIGTKSDKSINDLLINVEKTINERVHIDPIQVRYYAKDFEASMSENKKYADLVIETQTSITGIVVNSNGTRIIAITPIVENNATIGAIEVSQDIKVIKNSFEKLGKEFVFLLDKSQLVFMNLESKQGMTQDIGERYKIFFHDYNSQFYTDLRKVNFDKLQSDKYYIDSLYFVASDETIDIDGKKIGLFVIGESTKETNSFVNITQNLINSITTVALGLVISLILFMF